MTPCPFPQWDPEAKAPRGLYSDFKAFGRAVIGLVLYLHRCDLQGRTVPHHVERAGDAGENTRRRHRQTPASSRVHRRLPQQTPRGGGEEEEGEEERGEGGQV